MAITPPELEAGSLIERVVELARAGVDLLQLRQPSLSDGALLEIVQAIRRRAPELPLVVNARADVALAGEADGVHLPTHGLPLVGLPLLFPELSLWGCSTHTVDEVEAAARARAGYAVFGPLECVETKGPRYRPATESAWKAAIECSHRTRLPLLALGGVSTRHFAGLAARGVAGVAGIRLFFASGADASAVVAQAESAFGKRPKRDPG